MSSRKRKLRTATEQVEARKKTQTPSEKINEEEQIPKGSSDQIINALQLHMQKIPNDVIYQ